MNKMIEDCKYVTGIIERSSELVKTFVNNIGLLSIEDELLSIIKNIGGRPMSPEAMSDPENISRRQMRFHNTMDKLKTISDFKSDLINERLTTLLDLSKHPEYFQILGERFEMKEGKSFSELHPIAQEHLLDYLKSVDKFITTVSGQEYPEEECERECEYCMWSKKFDPRLLLIHLNLLDE